ncbi:MAG: FkbM family methyltransferase [Lentisphaeria bacterium]|nr:FkbM family methyltransferase [Lentisphaeria bacterium]
MRIPTLHIPPYDFSRGVVIYGAGKTGRFVLAQCRAAGIPVTAILDRHGNGTEDGVPFHRFPEFPSELCRFPIVLAVHDQVLDAWGDLSGTGFESICTMSGFYLILENRFHHSLPPYACLGSSTTMDQNQEEISAAYELLEDDISRRNFQSQLQYRRNGNIRYIQPPDPGLQYYPFNRPFQLPRPVNFVDCGAFTGDTLNELMTELTFESITAFEPDPEAFKKLRRFIAAKTLSDRILTLQSGVGEHNKVLTFCPSGGEGAAFGPGTLRIPVFSLDSLLCNYRVDFIKMDIEGDEAPALRGAAELIRREGPLLAISVYHKPEDLWKLPLLIKHLHPTSHLFLRTHRGSYHDTVCYAVPNQYLRSNQL